jgi:hypothetical protein
MNVLRSFHFTVDSRHISRNWNKVVKWIKIQTRKQCGKSQRSTDMWHIYFKLEMLNSTSVPLAHTIMRVRGTRQRFAWETERERERGGSPVIIVEETFRELISLKKPSHRKTLLSFRRWRKSTIRQYYTSSVPWYVLSEFGDNAYFRSCLQN